MREAMQFFACHALRQIGTMFIYMRIVILYEMRFLVLFLNLLVFLQAANILLTVKSQLFEIQGHQVPAQVMLMIPLQLVKVPMLHANTVIIIA